MIMVELGYVIALLLIGMVVGVRSYPLLRHVRPFADRIFTAGRALIARPQESKL